jgi:threonine/homoserine/homoserine lactone efflux protein
LLRILPRPAAATLSDSRPSYRSIAAQGFFTDVLNPKGALFFISFVPQFIVAGSPAKPLAFLILGCIFNANGVAWYAVLALFAAKARDRIQPTPQVARCLSCATAGLFIWIGVKLVLTNPQ